MMRRIFAWVLLLGFIMLFINLVFIGFHRSLSGLLYIIIIVFFFLTQKRIGKGQ